MKCWIVGLIFMALITRMSHGGDKRPRHEGTEVDQVHQLPSTVPKTRHSACERDQLCVVCHDFSWSQTHVFFPRGGSFPFTVRGASVSAACGRCCLQLSENLAEQVHVGIAR